HVLAGRATVAVLSALIPPKSPRIACPRDVCRVVRDYPAKPAPAGWTSAGSRVVRDSPARRAPARGPRPRGQGRRACPAPAGRATLAMLSAITPHRDRRPAAWRDVRPVCVAFLSGPASAG